jgi:catalase
VNNYYRDGAMRFDSNGGEGVNYDPNSFGGPVQDPSVKEPGLTLSGEADRYDHRIGNDDYSQPAALFRLMTSTQREQLFSNISASMLGVPERIVRRQLSLFHKVDPRYAIGVAAALGLSFVA